MIRINLIEGGQQKRARSARGGDLMGGGAVSPGLKNGLLMLAGAVLLVFGHYFWLQHQADQLARSIHAARVEQARLAALQQDYNENTKRKQELTARIAVIEDLKKNQSGPTDLLQTLSRTVSGARQVWLVSAAEKNGDVTLVGNALSMDAVAKLMNELLRSGFFRDVQLKESVQRAVAGTGNESNGAFNFTLVALRPQAGKS